MVRICICARLRVVRCIRFDLIPRHLLNVSLPLFPPLPNRRFICAVHVLHAKATQTNSVSKTLNPTFSAHT